MRIQKTFTDTFRSETRPLSLCARVNAFFTARFEIIPAADVVLVIYHSIYHEKFFHING